MSNILKDYNNLLKQIKEQFENDNLSPLVLMNLMVKMNELKVLNPSYSIEELELLVCKLIDERDVLINYFYDIDELYLYTPLSYSIYCGFTNIIKSLIERNDLDINMLCCNYIGNINGLEVKNVHPLLCVTSQLIETGVVREMLDHKHLKLKSNEDAYKHIFSAVIDGIDNCDNSYRMMRIKTLEGLVRHTLDNDDLTELYYTIWDLENLVNKKEFNNSVKTLGTIK